MSASVVPPKARSILFGHRWLCMRAKEKMPTAEGALNRGTSLARWRRTPSPPQHRAAPR